MFAIPLAMALALSWHPSLGVFRKSALNPMLLFAVYIVLVAGDYASMNINGSGVLAQHRVSAAPGTLFVLELKYVCMLIAALAGIATMFQMTPASIPSNRPVRRMDLRLVWSLSYLFVLVGWYVAVMSLGVDISSLSDTIEVKSQTSKSISLFVLSMMLLPAFTYMLPRQSYKVVIPLVLFSIGMLLLSGSRTRILYILVPFAFYLFRVRSVPIPRFAFLILAFIVGLLALAALNFRTTEAYKSEVTLSNLTNASNLFEINDLAFAETNLALSGLNRNRLEEYPGQSLVGFVFAVVPRSIVPFKPPVGSRQFTAAYDPFKYAKYNRGLTIGGVSEIEFDYPFPVALVIVYLFAAGWARALIRAIGSRSTNGFGWTVGLYVTLYVFLKADLQAAGQILFIFVFYSLIVFGVEQATRIPVERQMRPRVTPGGSFPGRKRLPA